MRGWEREPGEGSKAFACFKTYRDMPDRSLRKVAELVYGETSESNLRTLKRWSSKFEWQDRVAAHEARDQMIAREAVERHLRKDAEDRAAREQALLDKDLELREKAARQAEIMLDWPAATQEKVVEGQDGEEVTYVFRPAGWSKSTGIAMRNLSIAGAHRPVAPVVEDYSGLTEEEVETLLRIEEKIEARPGGEAPGGPGPRQGGA